MAEVLRPTADKLIPVAKSLRRPTTSWLRSHARLRRSSATTSARSSVRPGRSLASSRSRSPTSSSPSPNLTRSFKVLNTLFNLFGYNKDGREGPDKADRDEGLLFYFAWLAHQSTSVFGNADAHGPMRALTLGGTCATLAGAAKSVPGARRSWLGS